MGNKEKEFNNILDECLDRILFKGDTPEQCLKDYPEIEEELSPLLETAITASQVSSLIPDPAFKTQARTELFTYLREAEEKRSHSFFRFNWQHRMATVMAVILAMFAVTGGTAAASTGAMPDDFLYPVKIVTEKVQLVFTFTDLGKAEAYARMADRRVEEIVYMATQETVEVEEIEMLANDLNTSLTNIAVFSVDKNTESVALMAGGEQRIGMEAVTEEASMPKAVSDDMDIGETVESMAVAAVPEVMLADGVNETAESATNADTEEADDSFMEKDAGVDAIVVEPTKPEVSVEIPPTAITTSPASSEDETQTDREVLNSVIIEQANDNISLLYDILDIVPESVRPIIEKAIELSAIGYNNAINSLD